MQDDKPQPLNEADKKSFITKAHKTLHALCRGNGVKGKNITFEDSDILNYEISAESIFHVEPNILQKTVTGRQNGDVCDSQEALQARAHEYLTQLMQSSDLSDALYETVKSRADKGAGLTPKENIPLTNFSRDFVAHEGCGYCKTKGNILCQQCDGHRMVRCIQCDGITRVHCTYCHGTGRTRNNNNQEQSCYHCDATGQMPCRYCRANGKTSCRNCGGRGQISCTQCSGQGWFSHLASITLNATGTFVADMNALPQKLHRLISEKAGDFIKRKDIKATPDDKLTVQEDHNFHLKYTLKFPYGELDARIKKLPVGFAIFGYNKKLLHVPDFLDRLIKNGRDDLEVAASGHGNIAARLQKAARYRVIALALLGAAQASRRKTRKILKQKFPMGLSNAVIEKMTHDADLALSLLTRKPRYKGLAIGGGIMTIIFSVVYLSGLRQTLSASLNNPNIGWCIDLVFIGIGVAITTFMAQFMAKNALSQALGHLLPENQRQSMTPKAGRAFYIAIGLNALIALICLEASFHILSEPVQWYTALRQ